MKYYSVMDRFTHNAEKIRSERGMTIQSLADKIGMRRSQLSQLLSGKHSPSIETVERIAEGLECDISDLVEKIFEPA